jgi:hypothetical protein
MPELMCECGHEKRFHANAEKHNLGTSHCTQICDCKEYREKAATPETEKPKAKRQKV